MEIRSKDCNLCPLADNPGRGKVVQGEGPVPADIMIIGQAPGYEEARFGRPFVGPSGERLNQMLNLAGFKRKEIYITNMCCCYPPAGRDPRVEEVDVCVQGLLREIENVQPKLIILLGSVATRAFLKSSVTSVRGNVFIWEHNGREYVVVPTLHPAATLRRWEDVALLKRDFQFAYKVFRGKLEIPKNNKFIITRLSDLERLRNEAAVADYLIVDVECEGFDPDNDKLLCVGIRCGDTSYVIPWTVNETLEPFWGENQSYAYAYLREILGNQTAKVGHNIADYDRRMLEHNGLPLNNITYDTMLAHHLLDENMGHSMELIQSVVTTYPQHKQHVKEFVKSKATKYSAIPSEILWDYNADDVFVNDLIFQWEQQEMAKYPRLQKLFYSLTMPLADVIYDIENTGIMVDLEKGKRIRKQYEEEIERKEREIFALVGYEFNPKATGQVEKILFQELKLRPLYKTDSGHYSTDEETLKSLSDEHPFPKLLLELRKLYKLLNTYFGDSVNSTLKVDAASRIHPRYLITGAKHGRVSTVEPNFQSIPREGPVRELFVAPPGAVFVEIDESITEMRMMAYVSQDPEMLKAFRERRDIHKESAASLFSVNVSEVTDEQRYLAKFFDFGINYGRGPDSIAAQFGLSPEMARTAFDNYLKKYSKLAEYHAWVKAHARKYGWVEFPTGRRRRVPGLLDPITARNQGVCADMERSCIASICQGASADLHHYTLIAVHKALKAKRYKTKVVATLHDAWYFEVYLDELDEVMPMIIEILLRTPVEIMGLEIPVKVCVGECWGDPEGLEVKYGYD